MKHLIRLGKGLAIIITMVIIIAASIGIVFLMVTYLTEKTINLIFIIVAILLIAYRLGISTEKI